MTTEPPRPDQIQANVAAALSRLRGELGPDTPHRDIARRAGKATPRQLL